MPRFPPRLWRRGFPRRLGASFHGGKALTKSCLRASRPCASGRLRGTGSYRRPTRWNGPSSNGPRAKKSRRDTGFQPCPKTRPSTFSSIRPDCAGASSATTRNSKANSASPISRGEAGPDSAITHPLHRPLRFSHPRTSGDSPLRPPAARNASPILASQIPRRRQSDPSGTSNIRSLRSEDNSRSRRREPSRAAPVVKLCHYDHLIEVRVDTVELGNHS